MPCIRIFTISLGRVLGTEARRRPWNTQSDGTDSSVIAAQALSNLMLGSAFVPRVLAAAGPLPPTAQRLTWGRAPPTARELFAQMLLNAALHGGCAPFLDAARAPEVWYAEVCSVCGRSTRAWCDPLGLGFRARACRVAHQRRGLGRAVWHIRDEG
eukprot:366180-Chlamydomonas_euryale.AAC.1